jgi:acetylornithine deacetylase/succinyl-diaminopimelate desuccinylase-like protein
MVAQFRAIGCEARIDRGGNVIAQLNAGAQGPLVAVTAHLDTVLAPRKPEDISVGPEGTLRGPGVSDNGAGLAALLALARALKNAPRLDEAAADVLFIANVGEEGEGNLGGMRYLCRQSSIAAAIRAFIVLDGPSTEHITWKALASRRYEVVFTGSGGHSWSDFGAGNPVHALSRAITLFTDAREEFGVNGGPRTSFNFGTIDGGSSITSIPVEARAKVDIRSENGSSIDRLAQLLTGCVERAMQFENDRATTRVTAKVREIGSRPGGQLASDAAILNTVRAVDAHLGIKSQLDCASTDANVPLSMGLPAVSIGAGGQGGGAHTPAEWYHPAGREPGLSRILLLLATLLRNPA